VFQPLFSGFTHQGKMLLNLFFFVTDGVAKEARVFVTFSGLLFGSQTRMAPHQSS
jgi:hypothetical protein